MNSIVAKILSIYFPFQQGTAAFPRPAYDSDAIRASLIQILTTPKGTRVMRPTFGCDAFTFLFENDSDSLKIRIEREIRSSITRWEPRVSLGAITIETNEVNEPGQILVTIFYTILQSGQQDSVTIAGGGL